QRHPAVLDALRQAGCEALRACKPAPADRLASQGIGIFPPQPKSRPEGHSVLAQPTKTGVSNGALRNGTVDVAQPPECTAQSIMRSRIVLNSQHCLERYRRRFPLRSRKKVITLRKAFRHCSIDHEFILLFVIFFLKSDLFHVPGRVTHAGLPIAVVVHCLSRICWWKAGRE